MSVLWSEWLVGYEWEVRQTRLIRPIIYDRSVSGQTRNPLEWFPSGTPVPIRLYHALLSFLLER